MWQRMGSQAPRVGCMAALLSYTKVFGLKEEWGVVSNFQHSNLDLSQCAQLRRYQVNSMSKGLIESGAAAVSPKRKVGKTGWEVFPESPPLGHTWQICSSHKIKVHKTIPTHRSA